MKTIKTILACTALLACTSLFANSDTKATSEVKAKHSVQNTTDKADGVKKGINKTRTSSKNSRDNNQNFANKENNGSHPSNMDINGKTHAELDTYAGRLHSGFTTEAPNNDEE